MGVIRSWLNLVIVAAVAISGGAAQPPSTETFVTVNRCTTVLPRLGKETTAAPVLTTLRSHARQFDTLAPQFVDRFGVLALTRHAKDSSDKPPWGYDSTALAEDIKGFLDSLHRPGVWLATRFDREGRGNAFAALFPPPTAQSLYRMALPETVRGPCHRRLIVYSRH